MIPTPPGWAIHRGAREILLVHPAGLPAGAIAYEERLRPLAPVRELVAAALRARPAFHPERVTPPDSLITREGEHAAAVTVAGTIGGEPAQLDLGFVLLEDGYARLAGVTAEPERGEAMTATVRDLTLRDSHLLGTRPRRTLYARPAGWHGVARGLMTEWYPPEFPRLQAVMTVWPALPTGRGRVGWWRAACQPELGFAVDELRTRLPVISDHGLVGQSHHLVRRADGVARDVVALEDDRYVYLFRLEVDGALRIDSMREALSRLVRSTRPIPRRGAEPEDQAVLEHWV